MFSILILSFCSIANAMSVHPAVDLYRCKSDDDACVTNAVKEAYALMLQPNDKIGAEEMDPMLQKEIDGNIPGLELKLFDTIVKGFKTCEVQNAKFHDKNRELLHIDFLCPKFSVAGQYKVKGQLLTLPVEGNGDFTLDTDKYSMAVDVEVKTVTEDGRSYKAAKMINMKAEPLEQIKFELKNLFNGQKDLADVFHNFVHENYKEAAALVQDPVFMANINRIVENMNKYLKVLSIDEY